jgi:hypothetical protein
MGEKDQRATFAHFGYPHADAIGFNMTEIDVFRQGLVAHGSLLLSLCRCHGGQG